MKVEAYLNFDGRTEEAIEFYKRAVDAEVVMLMRFSDSPEPMPEGWVPAGSERKIMHSAFRIGDTLVMASDSQCGGKPNFQGMSLALTTKSDAEAKQRFDALADGGQVNMPLTKTFFSSSFGQLVDRFGVSWMVVVE